MRPNVWLPLTTTSACAGPVPFGHQRRASAQAAQEVVPRVPGLPRPGTHNPHTTLHTVVMAPRGFVITPLTATHIAVLHYGPRPAAVGRAAARGTQVNFTHHAHVMCRVSCVCRVCVSCVRVCR